MHKTLPSICEDAMLSRAGRACIKTVHRLLGRSLMREAKVSMRVNILSHSKCLAWRNVCAEQCEQTKRQTLTTMLTLHAMHHHA